MTLKVTEIPPHTIPIGVAAPAVAKEHTTPTALKTIAAAFKRSAVSAVPLITAEILLIPSAEKRQDLCRGWPYSAYPYRSGRP